MKTITYILLLITLCGCNAQNKNIMNTNKELTLEELKKQGYQQKEADTFMMKEGKLDIKMLEEKGNYVGATVPTDDGYQKTTTFRIEKTLDNGTYIYIRGNELSGYSKRITKKNNLITTSYGYYPSGNLKQITYLYPNLVKKGTWYWYNERGQINRLEEYDKPYKYTWENVLAFMQKKEIKKEDIYAIQREKKDEKTGNPFWYIEQTLKRDYNNNTILSQYYKLDGITGNIIEQGEQIYTFEGD